MGGAPTEALAPGRLGTNPEEAGTPREHRAPCKANAAHRATDSAEVPNPEDGRCVSDVVDAGRDAGAAPAGNAKALPGTDDRHAQRRRQEGSGHRKVLRLRAEGKALKGENPMSATGMKQGRKDCEGANRQEGEKP